MPRFQVFFFGLMVFVLASCGNATSPSSVQNPVSRKKCEEKPSDKKPSGETPTKPSADVPKGSADEAPSEKLPPKEPIEIKGDGTVKAVPTDPNAHPGLQGRFRSHVCLGKRRIEYEFIGDAANGYHCEFEKQGCKGKMVARNHFGGWNIEIRSPIENEVVQVAPVDTTLRFYERAYWKSTPPLEEVKLSFSLQEVEGRTRLILSSQPDIYFMKQ